MTVSAIQRAIMCEDCGLYLTVHDKTGLLATGGALFLVDGLFCEEIPNKILMPSVTLFNIVPRADFPFDEAAGNILAGDEPVFDIAATLVTKKRRLRTVFRDCVPKTPMGLKSAGDRWTFGVAPEEEVWKSILETGREEITWQEASRR